MAPSDSRKAYDCVERLKMWLFLYDEIVKGNEDALNPKGYNIWKQYRAENPGCGRTYQSLQGHYTRQMHDGLHLSDLTLAQKLEIYKRSGRSMKNNEVAYIERTYNCMLQLNAFHIPRTEAIMLTRDGEPIIEESDPEDEEPPQRHEPSTSSSDLDDEPLAAIKREEPETFSTSPKAPRKRQAPVSPPEATGSGSGEKEEWLGKTRTNQQPGPLEIGGAVVRERSKEQQEAAQNRAKRVRMIDVAVQATVETVDVNV
ncbi:hypothetical protein L596_029725 [Steinernema carpocapsae]|uniref:Uncharacterized protein n=1 Tax=Steinernema carpocapsae TaxID=34508 RepID=A0A4U5LQL8_STECR|nr:hypothetical protein L596_029725 [Steinernema carpocapsae]